MQVGGAASMHTCPHEQDLHSSWKILPSFVPTFWTSAGRSLSDCKWSPPSPVSLCKCPWEELNIQLETWHVSDQRQVMPIALTTKFRVGFCTQFLFSSWLEALVRVTGFSVGFPSVLLTLPQPAGEFSWQPGVSFAPSNVGELLWQVPGSFSGSGEMAKVWGRTVRDISPAA